MGYFCGYQYFLGFDGTLKQARGEEEIGAHCNAKLMNYIGIGICLAGDFTKHQPTTAQINRLEMLLTDIQKRWPIPDESILLHRECKPTACPGIDIRGLALARRRELERMGAESPPPSASALRALSRRSARIVKWLAK